MSTDISLEQKVEIRNLCAWDLYFDRIESNGTVKLPANGKVRISRAEIQAQVFDNNVMFIGTDGQGSHARIYIEDKDTRVLLGFEDPESNSKQEIVDSELVKKILEYKSQKAFEDNIKKKIITQAEKNFLVEEAKRQKLNDYNKIKFIEEYTGYKFNDN